MVPHDDWNGLGARNVGPLIALGVLTVTAALGPGVVRVAKAGLDGPDQRVDQTLGSRLVGQHQPHFYIFARPDRPIIATVANAGPDAGVAYLCEAETKRKVGSDGSLMVEEIQKPLEVHACVDINGEAYRSPDSAVVARDPDDPTALLVTVRNKTVRIDNTTALRAVTATSPKRADNGHFL